MFSGRTRYYLMNPVNGRPGSHYNGTSVIETEQKCRTNPNRIVKTRVKMGVCVERGKILELRWQVFGDPVARAVASWIAQEATDKQISEIVNNVIPERVILELDIRDELYIRGSCMPIFDALAEALEDYRRNIPPSEPTD